MAKFQVYQWILIWIMSQDKFIFDWDAGNRTKSYDKHQIDCAEIESAFENLAAIIVLGLQITPKVDEERFGLYAKTQTNKNIFISFTLRNSSIRVISARELNRKENQVYETLRKESEGI